METNPNSALFDLLLIGADRRTPESRQLHAKCRAKPPVHRPPRWL